MFKKFHKSDRGNVAVIFAIALVPVFAMLGASVEYSRASKTKLEVNAALDAATLAAARVQSSDRQTTGANFIASNIQNSDLTISSATFVTNSDGSVTGTVRGSLQTYVTPIFNVSSVNIAATTTVANGLAELPTQVIFQAGSATGWYWKRIDLVIANPGVADKIIASYIYQPTSQTTSTGTLTAYYPDSSGAMVVGAVNTPINLGNTYTNIYLNMTVYSDGCAPGYVVDYYSTSSNFKCAASGTTYTAGRRTYTYPQKTTQPDFYTTNPKNPVAASSAHNLFVNGVMMPNGRYPSVFDILPCPATVQQSWEDTYWDGLGSPPDPWSQQDFRFTVASSNCQINKNYTAATPITTTGVTAANNGKPFIIR